ADAQCCSGWLRPYLCARRLGPIPHHQGSIEARTRRLVTAVFGLSPLVSKPPAIVGGLPAGGRGAPLSDLNRCSAFRPKCIPASYRFASACRECPACRPCPSIGPAQLLPWRPKLIPRHG